MNTSILPKNLKDIQLLLLDVDGVLTDGSIIYSDGESETKVFNVKDGFGLKLVMSAGIKVSALPAVRVIRDPRRGGKFDSAHGFLELFARVTADTQPATSSCCPNTR